MMFWWCRKPMASGLGLSMLLALAGAPGCGDDATEPDIPPTLAPVGDKVVVEAENRVVEVTATHPAGEAIVLSASGLPHFTSFVDEGDGTGALTIAPGAGDAGAYPGVRVTAESDGEMTTSTFRITVIPSRPAGKLLYEPLSICLGADGMETLTVYNVGDESMLWLPTHVPEGSEGLESDRIIDPRGTVSLPWTWTGAGTFPVIDSLVVATSDPLNERMMIPLRNEGPDFRAEDDTFPPDAPLILIPLEAAVVRVDVQFEAVWTRVSDCSGISRYDVQLASNLEDFDPDNVIFSVRPDESLLITPDPGDVGPGYLWVRAVDAHEEGRPGRWSEPRSWTVVP